MSAVETSELPPGPAGETATLPDGIHVRIASDGHAVLVPVTATEALPVLRNFGRRVAIAVGYARARDQVEQLAVRLDRERIARDLHDTVIQRLFGAGLRLDGLTRQLADAPQRDAVEGVITELDRLLGDLLGVIEGVLGEEHRALWDGRTSTGDAAPLGLYIVRAEAPGQAAVRGTLSLVR